MHATTPILHGFGLGGNSVFEIRLPYYVGALLGMVTTWSGCGEPLIGEDLQVGWIYYVIAIVVGAAAEATIFTEPALGEAGEVGEVDKAIFVGVGFGQDHSDAPGTIETCCDAFEGAATIHIAAVD